MFRLGNLCTTALICHTFAKLADTDQSLKQPRTVGSSFLHTSRVKRALLSTDLEDGPVIFFQKSATVSHHSEQAHMSTDLAPASITDQLLNSLHLPKVAMPNPSEAFGSLIHQLDPFPSASQRRKSRRAPQEGQDIWNETLSWANFTVWHPAGVISNVYDGQVIWANVGFLSLSYLCGLTLAAYPILPMAVIFLGVIIISLSISKQPQEEPSEGRPTGASYVLPSRLTPTSQRIYTVWKIFCCTVPALIVFGTPLILVWYSYSHPQEVFVVTLVVCLAFAFNHGLYMVFFVPLVAGRFRREAEGALFDIHKKDEKDVFHWVFIVNYNEDFDVLSMAIQSIAKSTVARSHMGIVLAMEEREPGAEEKATQLCNAFRGNFKDIKTFYHPKDLPNDPPGKASNMSYAFKSLVKHLEDTDEDASGVMITVADADSEFHERYFEALTCNFRKAADPDSTIWQSPVYHLKNYHRQPGFAVVASLITAMTETACLADPNAIRMPYSTYSLPLTLANQVGGWDPEWIAEDWHMGIKCFLLTLGRSQVKPIFLPTLNYAPEKDTWYETLNARWEQAKRHALGFSDMSYFLMMLPLIFLQVINSSKSPGPALQGFWKLVLVGVSQVAKLLNSHALLGIMTLYVLLDVLLKHVMMWVMEDFRGVNEFFDCTIYGAKMFAFASSLMTLIITVNFQGMYRGLVHRLDKPSRSWAWLYNYRLTHWLCTVGCFAFCGLLVFPSMAFAVWFAAIKCAFMWRSGGFEYVVAAKPTKRNQGY
mmetsp:Transcript_79644/g.145718  ORF Transcript_79644/g.145718 Transcript_79644/m.145718 type:complete len:764 (+) Transcript_79644:113-2404(+)